MEKELKAQNRLKALELASIVYPNKVVRAEELVNTLKKREKNFWIGHTRKRKKKLSLLNVNGFPAKIY